MNTNSVRYTADRYDLLRLLAIATYTAYRNALTDGLDIRMRATTRVSPRDAYILATVAEQPEMPQAFVDLCLADAETARTRAIVRVLTSTEPVSTNADVLAAAHGLREWARRNRDVHTPKP